MANVTLKEVYKYYDKNETPSVADFNLEIKDKEFVVFVGPSGCGKSTTLRMIAGLEEINYGQISIDGRIVNNVEPKDRNIAMVFQNYALYPHMTVFDNMAFGLKLAKTPKEVRDESTIILKDKNGKKYNPFVLFFIKMFARTLKEERDEFGNIVYDDSGNVKYAVKKNKKGEIVLDKEGKPILLKRPYTIDEYLGKPVLNENGEVKLIAKLHTATTLRQLRVPKEELDENGKPLFDENGQPKYMVKKNADGTDVLDAGMPVYEERSLTEQEIKARIGTVRTNKNGDILYKMRKYTKSEIADKVAEAMRILDISQYFERKPKALSGGQRQRVAIGRAIVRKPKVFLMDEPLSNLDAKLRNSMRSEILLLRKRINTTFIYVTHDQTEAMTLGDRIVIMRDGFMQQVGTPSDVFDRPENLFVAGFIGSPQMNFFDAKLEKKGGAYVVSLYGKELKLTKTANEKLVSDNVDDKEIVLGVRPEHITMLHTEKPIESGIAAKVTVCEMMGSELYVHCEMEDGKGIIVRVPTIDLSAAERENIANGGTIYIDFKPEVMHVFDKESEKNLIYYSSEA